MALDVLATIGGFVADGLRVRLTPTAKHPLTVSLAPTIAVLEVGGGEQVSSMEPARNTMTASREEA